MPNRFDLVNAVTFLPLLAIFHCAPFLSPLHSTSPVYFITNGYPVQHVCLFAFTMLFNVDGPLCCFLLFVNAGVPVCDTNEVPASEPRMARLLLSISLTMKNHGMWPRMSSLSWLDMGVQKYTRPPSKTDLWKPVQSKFSTWIFKYIKVQ